MGSMVQDELSIAHFVTDEKFIDSAYQRFESVAPGSSTYYFISSKRDLLYIREAPITFVSPWSLLNPLFYLRLKRCSFVVVHAMANMHRLLVFLAPPRIKFLWVGLGYDYYELLGPPGDLLLHQTLDYVKQKRAKDKPSSAVFPLKAFGKWLFHRLVPLPRVMCKLTAFSPALERDYELITELSNSRIPPYIDWNYGSVSRLIDEVAPAPPSRSGAILLGNSATVTNNHIEALDLLRSVGVGYRQIICPLSYGDKEYGAHISHYGHSLFGDRFVPLLDYMALDDYLELISNCSVFVANHIRQQGLGNLIALMHVGARVFLNKRSPVFQDFTQRGAYVNSLDDLIEAPHLLEEPLTAEQVADNQRFLKGLSGSAAINEKTRNLISRMTGREPGAP